MSLPSERLCRLVAGLLIAGGGMGLLGAPGTPSPIQFSYRSIPFHLENDETPDRHVPAAMAGGVLVNSQTIAMGLNRDGRDAVFIKRK